LLALALSFLSFSMAFDLFDDVLWEMLGHWQFFWEDGAKLVGISLWATYFMGLARHALSRP
jgi:NO-binding membrane sensor protein with MHYT domain